MDELIKSVELEEEKNKNKKKNTRIIFFLTMAISILLSSVWFLYIYYFVKTPVEFFVNAEKIPQKNELLVPRRLDGVLVSPERKNELPVAIIIENFPDARPQAGLSRASLVYEAEAEGKITRFLAVFDLSEKIEKIGPIRSARPYFVDWAEELGALFVHCGGSPEALVKIKQEEVFDLNEFYNGGYFWRNTKLNPPHNIFTSTEKLVSFLGKTKYDSPNYASWKYQEGVPIEKRPENNKIDIIYSQPDFVLQWNYDMKSNNYQRFQAGEPHLDAEREQVIANNVVILYMVSQVIDKELRIKLENSGRGEAVICRNGVCEKGGWNKQLGKRLILQNQVGLEISLNRGITWIEIVSPKQQINY